ncbi:hypothetical protein V8E54_009061 [Elaphomyces granulatus]
MANINTNDCRPNPATSTRISRKDQACRGKQRTMAGYQVSIDNQSVVSGLYDVTLYHQHEPLLIVCGSNYGLDVVYQRLVRGMAPYNPPLSRDGIYRLTTEFGEDADMQMVSNTKSSSQDVLQQTLDQLTADEIDGSFFKLLRLSISNFPQKTDDEKEEMILLWEYLTYQACLAKEGQIFANPVDSQDMRHHCLDPPTPQYSDVAA